MSKVTLTNTLLLGGNKMLTEITESIQGGRTKMRTMEQMQLDDDATAQDHCLAAMGKALDEGDTDLADEIYKKLL